ncbi:MAG TPA: GNAT family N-acetyltransferase [Coriobacteriia bacterium]|nr:GNAT family N-acetyltransferase [Coriobacteriia bacterium]
MSAWREARPEEMTRLWPAARAAHLAPTATAFEALRREGPWTVRVSDAGDAMVLRRWRSDLDILALRAAWAPVARLGWLLAEARAVGAERGYASLLSPLVAESRLGPYLESGMSTAQRVLAYQALPQTVLRLAGDSALKLRPAHPDDIVALAELDSACFDAFWRYGPEELGGVLVAERVSVCEDEQGLLGYSSGSIAGSTATLGRLAVAPRAQRRGLGASLVRDVAAWAARSGALGLSLCTQEENTASQALYRRIGFVEIGESYAMALGPTGARPR